MVKKTQRRSARDLDLEIYELAAAHECHWNGATGYLHAPQGKGFSIWGGAPDQELAGYTKTQQLRYVREAVLGGFQTAERDSLKQFENMSRRRSR